MRLLLATLCSILLTDLTVFVQGQTPGNPPCDVCGFPNATLTNPSLNISVAVLNIPGIEFLTCEQILSAGNQGLIEPANCQAALAEPDIQTQCGCTPLGVPLAAPVPIPVTPPPSSIGLQTSAPTATPIAVLSAAPSLSGVTATAAPVITPVAGVPTSFPECFICAGDPTATISNPDVEVNATFLDIDGITVAQCKQIVDAGIAGFISPDSCAVVEEDIELQTQCGCSNLGTDDPTGSTLFPTEEGSDSPAGNTIGDVVSSSSRLSRLNKAVINAGLEAALQEPNATLTLLAPTNGAFAKVPDQAYLDKLIDDPNWVVHLQNVLFFHLTSSIILTQDILVNNTQQTTMLNNEFVVLSQGVGNNNRSTYTVTYPDPTEPGNTSAASFKQNNIVTENGVVHTINNVLLPSFIGITLNELLSTPVDGFTIFPGFFVLAFPAGLPPGDYTVLAPVDQAFQNLGEETLNALRDPSNIDLLTQIMNDHIVPGVNPSVLLTNGQTLSSLGGTPITVTIDNTTIYFNEAMVLAANLLANNGLIYAIDSVLDNQATVAPTDPSSDIVSDIPSTSPPPTITRSPNANIETISPTPSIIPTTLAPNTIPPSTSPPITAQPTTKAPGILSASPSPSPAPAPTSPPVDDLPTRAPSVRAPVNSSQKQIRTLSPTASMQRRRRRSGDNRN